VIENIASENIACVPYRYQNIGDILQTLRNLGVSDDNTEGVLRFLRDQGQSDDPDLYLRKPFDPKPQYPEQSRFSDGKTAVYYGAFERETARAEVIYHLPSRLGRHGPAYYREVNCDFRGTAKDLRSHIRRLPFLTADKEQGGYDKCNEVAKEAIGQGLDGLLTKSARRAEGTCVPVFRRDALSNSRPGRYIALSYDPISGTVAIDGDEN